MKWKNHDAKVNTIYDLASCLPDNKHAKKCLHVLTDPVVRTNLLQKIPLAISPVIVGQEFPSIKCGRFFCTFKYV